MADPAHGYPSWMADLPEELHSKPLNTLAIPAISETVTMDLHNLGCLLAFLSVAALTSGFQHNSLYGISHTTQLVSDLDLSTRYYTEVLGGMLVPKLSTGRNGINGDEHFFRFFYKEYAESLQRNVPLSHLGVPDIRSRGNYNVRWNFIMFSNLAVQLLQFVNRFSGQPYIQKDPEVGIAWVASTYFSISADQRIVPLQQLEDILTKLEEFPLMEENLKGFITSASVNSFRERRTQPLHSFNQFLSESSWISTTRGPDGERIAILYRKGNGSDIDLHERCKYKGVSQEMLDVPTRNKYQDSLSKRIADFTYLSIVVDDIEATNEFYIDILGGKKNEANTPMEPIELNDFWLNIAFQDYFLEVKERGLSPDEYYGIPTLSYSRKPVFGYSNILFDNTNLDTFEIKINDIANDPNSLTHVYRNWSSPAYINNNHYAFLVKDNITMETYVQTVERQSANRGMEKILFNQAPGGSNINMYETPFSQGDLTGFNYLYFKGPSGETMALSQFKGKAKEALQAAMEEYGTLSTAFPSTNPWNWDGFSRTCDRLLD